jgi:hypothetical protein
MKKTIKVNKSQSQSVKLYHDWSIRLNNDPTRKSLKITAVKKDVIEFIVHKFPGLTFAMPKEKFLEHFEPCVEK